MVSEHMPTVCVGDRVTYSAESGLTFTEDGQTYLVMNEDDIVVLVEEEAVA
jgi:co-chaperonin GroES (HSP10)